jgi:membrane protein required for colicin V production
MHTLDIVIAVIGVLFIGIGLKRGLIGEVIRLLAMIGGFFIAFLYYHDLIKSTPLKNLSIQLEIKNAIAFLLIYIVCALAILTIGWLVKKIIHLSLLEWLDRLLGAAIGLLKTLLIAYVVCLSISTLPVRKIQNDFNKSHVYRVYTSLPNAFTLKSMLKKRTQLRTIFNNKNHTATIDTLQNKIKKFKAVVDSAKEAETSSSKD